MDGEQQSFAARHDWGVKLSSGVTLGFFDTSPRKITKDCILAAADGENL